MTELEKAARMALEALEELQGVCTDSPGGVEAITAWTPEAIAALTQALATTEPAADPCPSCPKGIVCRTPKCGRLKMSATTERKGEPVAWMRKTDITELVDFEPETEGWMPLYTPPQVPEDVIAILDECRTALMECDRDCDYELIERIDAIDAARKGE